MKYRDFSEMPDEELRSLAADLSNPKEALRRIRRNRKLSDAGDVPTPRGGDEGLPIPASQDPLRRVY